MAFAIIYLLIAIPLTIITGGIAGFPLAWAFFAINRGRKEQEREEVEAYFEYQQEQVQLEKSRLHNKARNTGDFSEYDAFMQKEKERAARSKAKKEGRN